MSESGAIRLCVAYVLRRFPALSEAFVTHEILELRRAGVRVLVLSLLEPRDKVVSQDALEACQQDVYYAPFLSISMLTVQVGTLVRYPLRYLRALATAVFERKPTAYELAKALALFPKCIYFGRLCRQAGVSHVHAHWLGLATLGAEVVSTICDAPFSFSVHTIGDIEYVGLYQQAKRARAVRVNTHHNHLLIMRRFPELTGKIKMVRAMGTWPHEGTQRQDVPLGDANRQLLAIGRLIEKKGFGHLVEAVRILRVRGVPVRCLIIGDGPLRDSLAMMIEDRNLEGSVQLIGAVPHESVSAYLSACDVVVAPSVRVQDREGMEDGLPQVILEAMATGKPVVATDAGAISEVVQDGVTGLLVPKGDPERLAEAIGHLLADPRLRHQIGMRAREFVGEEFDNRRTLARLVEMFTN